MIWFSAYIFYKGAQFKYLGLQLFLFYFPSVLLAWLEKGTVNRSWNGQEETKHFVIMKIYESVVEACPSAILQLVVILTSEASLSSADSIILLFSTVLSTLVISVTLFNNFEPATNVKEQLVIFLRLLNHFVETWYRLVTFVGIFVAVDLHGFLFLVLSVVWRGFLATDYHVLKTGFGLREMSATLLSAISECIAEPLFSTAGGEFPDLLQYSAAVEFIISMCVLYLEDGDTAQSRKDVLYWNNDICVESGFILGPKQ